MISTVALTGLYEANFPTWGRCFWQDPSDGALFLAHTSGTTEVDYVYSTDSGASWSAPQHLFACDDLTLDNNFDVIMDPRGHIHSTFKYRGSGCYQFTGRVPGAGWDNASGLGPVGYCLTTDGASSSKGFHGSLFMSEGSIGVFGDPVTIFPAVRIVAKKADQEIEAWWLSHPFRDYPTIHSGIIVPGEGLSTYAPKAGPLGGYPITTDAGQLGGQAITFNVNNQYTSVINNVFGDWEEVSTVPIVTNLSHEDPGGSGLLPFGPQMAFCSGLSKLNPIIISSASGMEMYTTWAEAAGAGAGFTRVDSTATYFSALGRKRRAPNGIPLGVHIPSGQVYGINGQGLRGSGTLVDMSFTNSPNTLNIYYLAHNGLGLQCVNRVQCRMQREDSSTVKETQFDFSSLSHVVSGVREFAPATSAYAGGNENTAHWKNFKALRHPTGPGVGITKKELVATIGSAPVYPSGFNFVVWDFNESVKGSESFAYTMYDYDYVATSGQPVSGFGGIIGTVRVTNPDNAFDRNSLTQTVINSGSSMTLSFPQPTLFSRVEFQTNGATSSNRFPGANISGSMDGTNWYHVHTMGSGWTNTHIKLSAECPQGSDVNERIAPWVAKYLKFDFRQSQKRATTNSYNLTEIRLFGPGQLKGRWPTGASPTQTILRPEASRSTERFATCTEGTLPTSDWRTYGNFTWGVRSSGSWSRTSSIPHFPYPQNGLVASGLWIGNSNGNGDGFSLKPNDCVPANTSGVVDVNFTVYTGETSRVSGIANNRTISFDYRTDFPGSDDRCDVYVTTQGSSAHGTHWFRLGNDNANWQTKNLNVSNGDWTLRYVFYRGASATSSIGNIGQIWIDNIIGLNGPAQPSIGGFINGDANPASGVIHGYINARDVRIIHGYMSGSPLSSTIHGYIHAPGEASGSIHGYMSAGVKEAIHGYMFGRGDTSTSSIYGYMGPGTGVLNTTTRIYGLMTGEGEANRIHGFLMGEDKQASTINGYMIADGSTNTIHGFMSADGTASGIIHGYMIAQLPFSAIHGYMGNNALAPSGGGTVAGGPGGAGSTSGVDPTNFIYGFIKGESNEQSIHGYLEGPPGGLSSVHGFIPSYDANSIYGYIQGSVDASGAIHGYMDGIGFESRAIHGYMYGVSGIISASTHGYMYGTVTPSGHIYGFVIGIPSGITSQSSCYGHGSVPLPPVNAASGIPTVFFNT